MSSGHCYWTLPILYLAGCTADPESLDPSQATETAPATFEVRLQTTKGDLLVRINRSWAPLGADRFYNSVRVGFYDDVAFFRVLRTPAPFIAQFGINGNPEINTKWSEARISDDPVTQSNRRGTLVFAMAGPNTRTTQLFINYADNHRLDQMGFAPFGEVIEGMEVADSLYADYGEGHPRGPGPSQDRISAEGNAYLRSEFPELDYILNAEIVE